MTAATSVDQTRELGCAFFRALNERSLEQVDQLFADDIVMDFPGNDLIRGRRRVLAFVRVLLKKYPVLIFTIDSALTEHDRAFLIWSNAGNRGVDQPYHNRGATLFKVCNGKIVFISDYFKDTSFVNA